MVCTCLLRSHATCKGLEYARTHTCSATTAGVLTGGEWPRSGAGGGGGDLANTCIQEAICIMHKDLDNGVQMRACNMLQPSYAPASIVSSRIPPCQEVDILGNHEV